MEKSSIFCRDCPLSSRISTNTEETPVAFGGEPTPVSATTARHHLGSSDPAARFKMISETGDVLAGTAASVVAPAGLKTDEVSAYFEVCEGPNQNQITVGTKRFNMTMSLGKSCAALAAIEIGAAETVRYQS